MKLGHFKPDLQPNRELRHALETTGLERISLELEAMEAYACRNSMFLC